MPRPLLSLALLLATALPAAAETASLAVATNFAPAAERLAADYAALTGDQITVTGGATGKLYAQIVAGAPFDALLSADTATPARLAGDGLTAAPAFPYAVGQLALWSADPARDLADPAAALRAATHVAIANPDLAPYGTAAVEVIARLGLTAEIAPKLVTGENIGQAQTMVASGAAEVGFVAAAALSGQNGGGASWPVPADLHAPLRQDAVLLAHGAGNRAATGFLAWLATPGARASIAAAGYGLP